MSFAVIRCVDVYSVAVPCDSFGTSERPPSAVGAGVDLLGELAARSVEDVLEDVVQR